MDLVVSNNSNERTVYRSALMMQFSMSLIWENKSMNAIHSLREREQKMHKLHNINRLKVYHHMAFVFYQTSTAYRFLDKIIKYVHLSALARLMSVDHNTWCTLTLPCAGAACITII
jgi:hypothetical protein